MHRLVVVTVFPGCSNQKPALRREACRSVVPIGRFNPGPAQSLHADCVDRATFDSKCCASRLLTRNAAAIPGPPTELRSYPSRCSLPTLGTHGSPAWGFAPLSAVLTRSLRNEFIFFFLQLPGAAKEFNSPCNPGNQNPQGAAEARTPAERCPVAENSRMRRTGRTVPAWMLTDVYQYALQSVRPVITPHLSGGFALNSLSRFAARTHGRQSCAPGRTVCHRHRAGLHFWRELAVARR